MFLTLLLKSELLGEARLVGIFETRLTRRHLLMLLLEAREPIRRAVVIQHVVRGNRCDVVFSGRYRLVAARDGSWALTVRWTCFAQVKRGSDIATLGIEHADTRPLHTHLFTITHILYNLPLHELSSITPKVYF